MSSFWEHISAPDQNIFMKFGGYVDNGLPSCVEWFKYDLFENKFADGGHVPHIQRTGGQF